MNFLYKMSLKKKLLSGSFILSLGTFASYILGAVRDAVFGNFFGISGITDAYLGAFLLADILMMIFISSALLGIVTPLFLREKNKHPHSPNSRSLHTSIQLNNGNKISGKIFGNFFASLLLVFAFVLLLAGIFSESIFQILSPEIFANYPDQFVYMGRLFLFSNFLFAISNFLGTYLMAHQKFLSTSLAPLFYNAGIILGILFFADTFPENSRILSAAYGAVFGAFLHLLARLSEYFYSLHTSKKSTNSTNSKNLEFSGFYPHIDFSDPILRELAVSMLWKMGSLVIVPLTFLLFMRISGEFSGLYTAFQYMRNLQSAPVAIFGISLATAVFPLLSRNQAENNSSEFSRNFWRVFGNILYWTLPSAIGVFFLGADVLSLLYGVEKSSSAFEWVEILAMFLSGILVFEALFHLLSRAFYSSSDISTPLKGGLIFLISSVSVLFIGKIYFPEYFVYFLGGAYFAGYFFQSIFLLVKGFQQKLFSFPEISLQQKILKIFIFSGLMGMFLYFVPEISGNLLINILIISVISAGIYFSQHLFTRLLYSRHTADRY